ncbi:flagellar motor protein MotB [Burkholderia vietnamiensis]|jgi:chemotaxis protein MotB|uniref:OmpA/MotB domain protein n=2 Tax=Burkholderia vietnamiensis TaxID=60552 RepID=A4JAC6_BURVG|nr:MULTISPECIES: flagellar motor protein MotB [Burkholderia]ABO53229.1 OmpA/MotB domain protein [Burkholderia vietnamiensis G4]TPQ48208.1 motility protein MotB [Burkholderia ubonensis]AFJ84545.1 Flagellar motor rotation protein MotB [Burkholderia sp. KJ006]AJY06845.1 membrane MotB of proton-channel complex MotA/MotB family protein [Burkholderia vietnamiensis LMG 10929]AOJ12234.1 flagellar motor protein MotB [Burkholderia vietnamiensis]
MSKSKDRAIVVKRVAPQKKGHHGGAWKLAYADFMTAMMAFFLLMWLLSSATPVQLKGIAEYFNTPLQAALFGSGDRSSQDSSIINGGGRDLSSVDAGTTRRTDGSTSLADRVAKKGEDTAQAQAQGAIERREQARLHDLQIKLMAAIEANPTLRQFRQQIRIDSTLMGLRIEIVDSQKRPMFAMSSNNVEPYMRDILREIGKTLNDVPNRIIVQGHTDAVPYAGGEGGYSNWELSADRANASRRELIAGGMDEAKVLRVLGLASTQNLNKADPLDPENRRISVIVLNRKSEEALMRDDATTTTLSADAAGSKLLGQQLGAASAARPVLASAVAVAPKP